MKDMLPVYYFTVGIFFLHINADCKLTAPSRFCLFFVMLLQIQLPKSVAGNMELAIPLTSCLHSLGLLQRQV